MRLKNKNNMKKVVLGLALAMTALVASAKDIKTVVLTTTPQMHCSGCENRIKENLKYLKGIKGIETSVENQAVTIEYDADKTSVEKIKASLKKINFDATEKQCDGCKEGKNCNDCKKNEGEGNCCKEGNKENCCK